jgi:hypothetical protein
MAFEFCLRASLVGLKGAAIKDKRVSKTSRTFLIARGSPLVVFDYAKQGLERGSKED